jgi:hypothetical protein
MAYKAIVINACRSDYESGNYTLAQIGEKRGIPSKCIEKWSCKFGWRKSALVPQVQAAINEKTIETLARLGMPKEKALRILIDGLEKPEFTQFEGKGDQMIATPMKDYKLILGYLKEYLQITDMYPAQKIELDMPEPIYIQNEAGGNLLVLDSRQKEKDTADVLK